MNISAMILGLGAGTIFLASAIVLVKIVSTFEEDSETALTKFLIKESIQKGFKILAISSIVLGVVLVTEVVGFALEDRQLQNIARSVAFIPMLGIFYFYYTIMKSIEPKN